MNDSQTTDEVVRATALTALWGSVLAVTFWWAADGGIDEMGTWGGWLMTTGRLAGLIASVLMLAQVLMIARVPVIERAFGQDALVKGHRLVGIYSIVLMLLHIAFITLGYAGGSVTTVVSTFLDLVLHYPAMLLAFAGATALMLVAVSSMKAARRRIRYESWHLLHLYSYLGAGLALPHQLWTGKEFLGSQTVTTIWWAVWGLIFGTVLVWRVLVPIGRSLRHRLRVVKVVDEGAGVTSVYVQGSHLDELPARAGQFFTWRFLDGEGWARGKPYSLSAAPDGRTLRIGVKAVGPASAHVRDLQVGTRVAIEGPYGRMTGRTRTQRKVAFIGAGVGITPLRALAEEFAYAPGEAAVLQRYATEPLFVDEFIDLAKRHGLRLFWLPGQRRWAGSMFGGYVDPSADDAAALRHLLPDIAERDIYVCGPPPWIEAVREALRGIGVPDRQVHSESFELVKS